jgi:hypothetical protein
MPTNEQRVAALEAKSGVGDQSRRLVIAEVGEIAEQVLERLGIEPNAKRVLVVTFGSPKLAGNPE